MNPERENLLNILKESILKCTGKEMDISEKDSFESIGFPIYRSTVDIINILTEFEISLNIGEINNLFYYDVSASNETFGDLLDYIIDKRKAKEFGKLLIEFYKK